MNLDELHTIIADLAAMPDRIRALASAAADPRRKQGDFFSVVENVCHLRDIEAEGYAVRIRRLLEEDEPLLDDLNGSQLAIDRRYNDDDLGAALDAFAEARNRSVAMLRAIGDERALQRRGTYAGEGPVTLADIVTRMREHDDGHLRDIDALR